MKLLKNGNDVRQNGPDYTISKTNTIIDLPVFTHTIKTTGTKASVSFTIMSKEDIGYYDISVLNEVDVTVRTFEIIPTGICPFCQKKI